VLPQTACINGLLLRARKVRGEKEKGRGREGKGEIMTGGGGRDLAHPYDHLSNYQAPQREKCAQTALFIITVDLSKAP